MEQIVESLQYFGFLGSLVLNSFLLFLLHTRAHRNFGKYRILMIVFCLFAIVYSLVEVLTLPVMFVKGRSLCVCSNGPLRLYRPIGVPLTSIYCGSFGMCISLLTLHFFYRYVAVCKPDKMRYFNGKHIFLTFSPSLFIFVTWSMTTYWPMAPDEMREIHYHDVLMKTFQTNSFEASFVAMMFQDPQTSTWLPSQLLSCAYMSFLMSVCFSVIVFCGYQALKQMRSHASHMSSKTKELNKQLFMTLGIQTLLPVFTMYIPVGCLMILPMFGIELGAAANNAAAFLGLYPALDPLVAILLIKDFRNFVFCKSVTSTYASAVSNTAPPSKILQASRNQSQNK
ncbi:Protein CBR-STR-123 [Caenorhabditis briggsae]|uniref:Serpentine receptor class r-10 n=2 Tax=Caenorhabditis briggsae TaxID=6238 RepID=A8WM88_CAEBR|nr:Protein CBR-STR-123 [Caenorhabditis briggsae]CAP21592.2 Protein CBR-STR-123 [Caenorhabditis briggsae]